MFKVDVQAVLSFLCLQAVIVYASEPSCPDATFGKEILEQTLETKTILKVLQQEVASIRDGLYERAVSFNEQISVDVFKQNLSVLYSELQRMEVKLEMFETRLTKEIPNKPAFSVALAQNQLRQENYHKVIKFDTEVTNIGGHYSKLTGQFTAPMDGVYMFSASILAYNNEEIWGYIKARGNLARIYGRGTDNRHGQGSQTMVVALQKGDNVTVHGGPNIYGVRYTTFSGFLVQ